MIRDGELARVNELMLASGIHRRGGRGLRFVLALLLTLLLTACREPEPAPPNVLLISIDSLRADHVGAYGYDRDTTPVIDRLAAEGAVFTTAASSSTWTLPAHAAMMTGLFDFQHRVVTPGHRLRPEIATLAESFQAAGYRTFGLYSGPFLHPDFGFAQGFDEYVDCTGYELENAILGREAEEDRELKQFHRRSHTAVTNPIILQEARERFLRLAEGGAEAATGPEGNVRSPDRFFMFIHMFDPHYDFVPPPPYDEMYLPGYEGDITSADFMKNKRIHPEMPVRDLEKILALYDGEIRSTDDTIGRLLESVRVNGMLSNTIVVVTADHGEEFFEHGEKGHRRNLYEETLRIPLVIWYPPAVRPGRIDAVVRLIDIAPTLLQLCSLPMAGPDSESGSGGRGSGEGDDRGAAEPERRRRDGAGLHPIFARSLLPLIESSEDRGSDSRPAVGDLRVREIAFSSIRVGDDKLIIDARNETLELFDLGSDSGEQNPVTADPAHPEVGRLRALLEALRREADSEAPEGAESEFELDSRIEEQLRELGYIE